MPSLLLDDDQRPLGGGLLGLGAPRIEAADVTPADAADVTAQQVGDFVDKQRAISEQRGLWDSSTGLPTQKGLLDAVQQYSQGLLFGTTAPGPVKPGFTAFHGSPHDFNAFDASKIGTGEGAQAYGHGMYLAENEGIARSYRDNLTEPNLPTPTSISGKPTYDLWNKYADERGAITIDGVAWHGPRDFVRNLQQGRTTLEGAPPDLAAALQSHVNKGNMYEVGVNADPAHFLQWDQTIGTHPDAVREKLLDMGYGDTDLGRDVYAHLSRGKEGDVGASAKLREAGIPGISYLDAGSRAGGEGTRNHVIFDAATMEILRKYGLAGLIAGGAGAAASRGNGS